MRALTYHITKKNALDIYTKSYDTMKSFESQGCNVEIILEDIPDEFNPTEKRKEWIENRG